MSRGCWAYSNKYYDTHSDNTTADEASLYATAIVRRFVKQQSGFY